MEISNEVLEKAKKCATAGELVALLEENEIEISSEMAEAFLTDYKEGELADAELEDVAGGKSPCAEPDRREIVYYPSAAEVQYIFNVGDRVEFFIGRRSHTKNVRICGRRAKSIGYSRWKDEYRVEERGVAWGYYSRWYFEK